MREQLLSMTGLKFDDPYWEKYSGEKRIIKCDWCGKDIDLQNALFIPVGNSRHRAMCKECDENSVVVECSFKYPTDEQLGINRTRSL